LIHRRLCQLQIPHDRDGSDDEETIERRRYKHDAMMH